MKRKHLAEALRSLRTTERHTRASVAEALQISSTRAAGIERASVLPTSSEVRQWCGCVAAPIATTRRLVALRDLIAEAER